ncbi:class I SAM-dependent methyltransferase [Halobacterium sp. KA-4]|jgi:ubiquinone/menaquinone biosynthesis C-methylase UbiE|uniref:class I SAM-dependent methyltransferase n=1 Tax=Halobacterium sp. KA-4 TaxID=2896367 RepID=UPI001E301A86|nr:class I SAM-dependent methyltransferase [Halobacterium sp. KA-4]MCD2199493.1 class I SAM-dependent methyltransferase [Halobacterium sp. KA-4]
MHDVQYFEWFAPVYDLVMPAADRGDLAAGLAAAERPVECVLDVGGGTGRAARALARDTTEVAGRDVTVVDASARMLAEARESGLPAVRGDAAALPYRDDSVDAITIVDALHHFPDRDGALAEAKRVLRPGGVLVVRDFNPETLRGRLLVAAEHAVAFHSSFDAPDDLATRMEKTGLDARVLNRGFAYTVVGVEPGPT